MTALEDRIKTLEERLKQAKVQKQQRDARTRAAETKKKRAADTRRKVLAGALILDLCDQNPDTREQFLAKLDAFLTRDDDRALFGLTPRQTNTP